MRDRAMYLRVMSGLTASLVLGASLRFHNLMDESYWLDEIYSADFSNPSRAAGEVAAVTLSDIHPPLYQLLLWAWYHIFGYTELAGRVLSAVLGTACIGAVFLLGREIFDRRAGVAAAAIAAVNLYLVQYSQETRSYMLFVLMACVSWWTLYRAMDRRTGKELAGYVVVTILLMYTHYYSFFFVAAQFVYVGYQCLARPALRRNTFVLGAVAAVAFAIALVPVVPYLAARLEWGTWTLITRPSPTVILEHIRDHFGLVPLLLLLPAAAVALWRAFSGNAGAKEKDSVVFLLLWLAFGYLVPFIKSLLSTPVMGPRYSLPQLVPVVLLCAYGYAGIASRLRLAAAAVFGAVSVYVLAHSHFYPVLKDEYRFVLSDLGEASRPMAPVYERIPFNGYQHQTNHFQVYAGMLGIDVEVRSDKALEEDRARSSLPQCFWLLDANHHPELNPRFGESPWAAMPGLVPVQVNSYRGAESVLVANGVDAAKCHAYRLAGITSS